MPDAWWAWAGLAVDCDAVDDAGGLLGLLGLSFAQAGQGSSFSTEDWPWLRQWQWQWQLQSP